MGGIPVANVGDIWSKTSLFCPGSHPFCAYLKRRTSDFKG